MKLSDLDKDILAGIEQKRAILRRRVDSVARGYTSALFVHGPGGHGKSHIIEEQLNRFPGRQRWRHYNSSMSAAGFAPWPGSSTRQSVPIAMRQLIVCGEGEWMGG
jgi:hypothetical protein